MPERTGPGSFSPAEIEQINFLKDKKAAFVNLCVSILPFVTSPHTDCAVASCDVRHASKALDALKVTPEYEHMRLAYGKDRCAGNPRPGYVISRFVRSGL